MGILFSLPAKGALSAAIALAGLATSAVAAQPQHAPAVNTAAFSGQGQLAFLWTSALYVLDGDRDTLRQIGSPGTVTSMAWSPDGQYLAYIQPAGGYSTVRSLWLARAIGGQARQVHGLPAAVSSIAWSPRTDTLAVVVAATAPAQSAANGLWLVTAAGSAQHLVRGTIDSMAWAPDGHVLAYSLEQGAPSYGDALYTRPATGGQPTRRFLIRNAGIQLAGWWPDDSGVVFWRDPVHSASLAADGMGLYTLRLGGTPHLLTTTLGNPQWLSWAPSGHQVLVVAGAGREVWHDKALTTCDALAGTCHVLPPPAGSVALDPAWAPDGAQIAYVVARDAGAVGGLGTTQQSAWVRTRTLWIAAPSGAGARPITAAGQAISQPMWSRDGTRLLYVRDNALWLVNTRGGAPVRVVGPFPQMPGGAPAGSYGALPWSGMFAWYAG
jgi:TolB protein